MSDPTPRSERIADVVAGLTVALVLIPQSLAYADLAGLPPWHGLYAAAAAPLLAAPFVSSRYLQTGPVALTSLLTLGALGGLAATGSPEYVGLAALLALVVGVLRVTIGWLRLGKIAWLMSPPVMKGFTLAAGVLIIASQLPAALGVTSSEGSLLGRAFEAGTQPSSWSLGAVLLSAITIVLVRFGRSLHPMFPGVLVAVGIGLACSAAGLAVGPQLGSIPEGLPPLQLDLPWASLGDLLLPGAIIALVGFAEAAAISQTFASADRESWDPDREFLSQGAANIAAGLVAGFPVGGSFSRSALGRLAGARSSLAGAVTGLTVLAILPVASVLAPLPRAVLGATVIGAVLGLANPRPLLEFWSDSKREAAIGVATAVATLAFTPHIEYGVLAGVVASLAVHLLMDAKLAVHTERRGQELVVRPTGTLWFGTAPTLRVRLVAALAESEGTAVLRMDLAGLTRIDTAGATMLKQIVEDARKSGVVVHLDGVPASAADMLAEAGELEQPGGHAN